MMICIHGPKLYRIRNLTNGTYIKTVPTFSMFWETCTPDSTKNHLFRRKCWRKINNRVEIMQPQHNNNQAGKTKSMWKLKKWSSKKSLKWRNPRPSQNNWPKLKMTCKIWKPKYLTNCLFYLWLNLSIWKKIISTCRILPSSSQKSLPWKPYATIPRT